MGGSVKCLVSGRGVQHSWFPVIPLFLIHFASMFPEVFVALDVELYKVADFHRIDFSGAAVADLRKRSVIRHPASIQGNSCQTLQNALNKYDLKHDFKKTQAKSIKHDKQDENYDSFYVFSHCLYLSVAKLPKPLGLLFSSLL